MTSVDIALAGAGSAATVLLLAGARQRGRRAALARRRRPAGDLGAVRESTGRVVARVADWPGAHPGESAVIGAAVGFLAGGVALAAVAAAGLALVPRVAGRLAAWRREQRFCAAFPLVLDDMARGMRAGLSPSTAICDAVTASSDPVRASMAPLVDRLQRGSDLPAAVRAWADGWGSPDGELLAMVVAVAAAVGAMQPRSIDAVADTVRERRAAEAEIGLQALQARLSAAVMTLAPFAFCAFLVLSDARASHFLLHTSWGLLCGLVGVSLDALAAAWMARIARGPRP